MNDRKFLLEGQPPRTLTAPARPPSPVSSGQQKGRAGPDPDRDFEPESIR